VVRRSDVGPEHSAGAEQIDQRGGNPVIGAVLRSALEPYGSMRAERRIDLDVEAAQERSGFPVQIRGTWIAKHTQRGLSKVTLVRARSNSATQWRPLR